MTLEDLEECYYLAEKAGKRNLQEHILDELWERGAYALVAFLEGDTEHETHALNDR